MVTGGEKQAIIQTQGGSEGGRCRQWAGLIEQKGEEEGATLCKSSQVCKSSTLDAANGHS